MQEVQKQEEITAGKVFDKVVEVIRENIVAVYQKESETSLFIYFAGGKKFRMQIEEIS